MDSITVELLVVVLVVTGGAAIVWIVRRLVAPPAPDEAYWRFVPHWTPDRVRKLHVIDPDMPELARKAAETLLHEARREGRRS